MIPKCNSNLLQLIKKQLLSHIPQINVQDFKLTTFVCSFIVKNLEISIMALLKMSVKSNTETIFFMKTAQNIKDNGKIKIINLYSIGLMEL